MHGWHAINQFKFPFSCFAPFGVRSKVEPLLSLENLAEVWVVVQRHPTPSDFKGLCFIFKLRTFPFL